MFPGNLGIAYIHHTLRIPTRWSVSTCFTCSIGKRNIYELIFTIWTMLGICHNVGSKCDSWEACNHRTSLSVSSVHRPIFASSSQRTGWAPVNWGIHPFPFKVGSTRSTKDRWEPCLFWELYGEYFTNSAIHSCVNQLSLINKFFLVSNLWSLRLSQPHYFVPVEKRKKKLATI